MALRFTTFILLTLVTMTDAQIMTREEAAVIARAVCDKIGLSGQPLRWQTTQELPTPVEVPEDDHDLQDALALMGYNPQPTLYPLMSALPFVSTPYDDLNYIYWCGDFMVAVNAYSGQVLAERQSNFVRGESVLPKDRLESIAHQLTQAFLGNKPWRWRYRVIPDNPVDSAYFSAIAFDPSSGADLLDFVNITLNATTGELLDISVYQRTVTVSTEPLLTSDEAKNLAESALKSFHPESTIIAHPEDDLLLVFEDSARKQFLAWRFHYTVFYKTEEGFQTGLESFIMIDAHIGQVLWREEWVPMGIKTPPKRRHGFEGNLLVLNGRWMTFGQPLLLRNGRVYLWTGYLPFFKIEQRDSYLVVEDRQLRLAKVDLIRFNGRQYVALRAICDFAGIRLWWDNKQKVPVLRAEWLEAKKILAQRQR